MSRLPSFKQPKPPSTLADITNNNNMVVQQQQDKANRRTSLIPRFMTSYSDGNGSLRDRRRSMLPVPKPTKQQLSKVPSISTFDIMPETNTHPDMDKEPGMTENSTASLSSTKGPFGGSADEYINMLDAYINQDVILEKQQTIDIVSRTKEILKSIKEIELEKNQIIKQKKKIVELIEDKEYKINNVNRAINVKSSAIGNEIKRHRKLVDLKKNELVKNYTRKFNEIESQFEELAKSIEDDKDADVERERILNGVRSEIESMQEKIDLKGQENAIELKKLNGELKRKLNETVVELDETVNVNQLEIKDAEFKKQRLDIELKELKSKDEEIVSETNLLREQLNNIEHFKGSLDDQVSELKLQKLDLIHKLETKTNQVEDFKLTKYNESLKNYREYEEKFEKENYSRLKIENQIMDLKKKTRVTVMTDLCLPIVNNDDSSICVDDLNYDYLKPLKVYLEDALIGLSFTVCQFEMSDNLQDIIYNDLNTKIQTKRFKRYNFEIKRVSIKDLSEANDISRLNNYHYEPNSNYQVIVISSLNLQTKKQTFAVIIILKNLSMDSDLPISRTSEIYRLYQRTMTSTIFKIQGKNGQIDYEDVARKLAGLTELDYVGKTTSYSFMNDKQPDK